LFIRSITIERYRGIEQLVWQPTSRLNCFIGPGDSGKSSILAAIELLLDPRATPPASEFDYYCRRVERGFQITGVLGDLDEKLVASLRNPPLQGWLDGAVQPLPDERGAEAVLVAKVCGSPELELSHVLCTPGEADDVPFPAATRRRLLLSRIASGARAGSELRLGRGTLLDRHAGGSDLHAALRIAVTVAVSGLALPEQATEAVAQLRALFARTGLPAQLHLGLITPQGSSLLGLVGLLEGATAAEAIPLSLAGTGTRQLALFRLGASLIASAPVVVLDEPELGLEPYRQRRLVRELRNLIGMCGQAFLTTHSPAVLQALQVEEIARLTRGADPVGLAGRHIARVQRTAPEALLARLPVLCEGDTEAGLLDPLLNHFAAEDGLGDIDGLGIRLVARSGHETVLNEADEFLAIGIEIGLFVDEEDRHSGRRAALAAHPACAYGSWTSLTSVRNVEEAVAASLSWSQLPHLLELASEQRQKPLVDLLQQINQAIDAPGRTSLEELRDRHGEHKVREGLAAAMQSKSGPWFKSLEGGKALGQFLLDVGLPAPIAADVRAFWGRVREVSGWA
jgi:putative ATP-dependent endonuclease of OLD family